MKLKLTMAAAVLCLGVSAMSTGQASAASGIGGLNLQDVRQPTATNSLVQQVASRKYDRNAHGPRYRSKHKGYTHYHDGYWYATPWWTAAAVGGAILGGVANTVQGVGEAVTGGGNDDHVSWCEQRYRSYDPATDTYVGRGGVEKPCVSPY